MKLLKFGEMFFLALVLSSCVSFSKPPPMAIYLGNGIGGAEGVNTDGEESYKSPSEIKNWIILEPIEFGRFSSWCYGEKPK